MPKVSKVKYIIGCISPRKSKFFIFLPLKFILMILQKISILIIKKATRKRKDKSVKGSTVLNAFLENRKLSPKIKDVSIPDKIGRIFVL